MLIKGIRKLQLLLLFCVIISGSYFLPGNKVYAADTAVRVVSVNYYDEQIILLNNGNTKIYYATETEAAQDNWEVITPDSGLFTSIDISWLSPSVENILVFKGKENPTASRITISDKPLKLEVTINYSNLESPALTDNLTIDLLTNIMTDVGNGQYPVGFKDLEWRKGLTGQWTSTSTLTVGLFKKLLIRGTYIYFRIRALDDYATITDASSNVVDVNLNRINGTAGVSSGSTGINGFSTGVLQTLNIGTNYPNGTKGRRFSSEVKVKVLKQATAMVYGVDGEKFSADIKYGKEYRYTMNGATSGWYQVTDKTVKQMSLSTIINNPLMDGISLSGAFPALKIEIRDYSTSKASSSKITEINLNAQRTINNKFVIGRAPVNAVATGDSNIYMYYNGDKNLIVSIPTASVNRPYEYSVVKKGDTFDINRAMWSSITKGTEVKILAAKAVEGGTLYIRMREIKSREATATTAAVGYQLASSCQKEAIFYPSIPDVINGSYTFTKGYSPAITFNITLNEASKIPFETSIKSVKLGTKEIVFDPPITTTVSGASVMIVTLRVDSLLTMTSCNYKPLTITFTNGTVDKTSIKLTIQSPVPASPLTITNAKGTNPATTAFTVVSSKGAGNTWAYVVTAAAIASTTTADKIATVTPATAIAFTTATVDNITATATQYITVFELDTNGYIIKCRSVLLTPDMIKP